MNIHLTLHDGTPETVRTDTAVSGNCTVGFRAYRYGASPIRLRPDVGLPDMADFESVNGALGRTNRPEWVNHRFSGVLIRAASPVSHWLHGPILSTLSTRDRTIPPIHRSLQPIRSQESGPSRRYTCDLGPPFPDRQRSRDLIRKNGRFPLSRTCQPELLGLVRRVACAHVVARPVRSKQRAVQRLRRGTWPACSLADLSTRIADRAEGTMRHTGIELSPNER